VEKFGIDRQTTDDSVIRRMRIVCWINNGTNVLKICSTYCFPQRRRLSAKITYVASLVHFKFFVCLRSFTWHLVYWSVWRHCSGAEPSMSNRRAHLVKKFSTFYKIQTVITSSRQPDAGPRSELT